MRSDGLSGAQDFKPLETSGAAVREIHSERDLFGVAIELSPGKLAISRLPRF